MRVKRVNGGNGVTTLQWFSVFEQIPIWVPICAWKVSLSMLKSAWSAATLLHPCGNSWKHFQSFQQIPSYLLDFLRNSMALDVRLDESLVLVSCVHLKLAKFSLQILQFWAEAPFVSQHLVCPGWKVRKCEKTKKKHDANWEHPWCLVEERNWTIL